MTPPKARAVYLVEILYPGSTHTHRRRYLTSRAAYSLAHLAHSKGATVHLTPSAPIVFPPSTPYPEPL